MVMGNFDFDTNSTSIAAVPFDLFLNDLPDLRPTTSSTIGSAMNWDDYEQGPLTGGSTHSLTGQDASAGVLNISNTGYQKDSSSAMAIGGSTNSSPADFAFEPPMNKTPFQYSNPTTSHYYGAYSTGNNSFSSASSGGASFSSADALPAISRDFARPSPVDTRRPATAGGALGMGMGVGIRSPQILRKEGTIEEEMFTNPFGTTDGRTMHHEAVDPRHVPANRRASDGFNNMAPPPTTWQTQQMPNSAAQYSFDPAYRTSLPSAARPVTSDGLPSFGGIPALPSARSVVGSVDGFTPLSGLQPAAHIRSSFDDALPFRDNRPDRFSRAEDPYAGSQQSSSSQKKRPRRRYDEIERMYLCGWSGCEKSYGTLNHLNAHVAMQKHGEKRLPSEFKDLRKAFRKRKREQAAAMANANASAQYAAWARSSMSSESDYSRRDSFASAPRYSVDGGMYDSRPNTASSVASSVGSGYGYDYSQAALQQQAQAQGQSQIQGQAPAQVMGMNGMLQVRRDSAPQHIPLPTQPMGFRQALDGPTPTQQDPFPGSAAASVGMPGLSVHTNRQHLPALSSSSASVSLNGLGSAQGQAPGGYPFQALNQPMPAVGMAQGYQQFAFQR